MWGEKKKKSLHFEGFLGRRGLRMQPGFTVNKKVKRTLSEGIVDVENFVAVDCFMFGPSIGPVKDFGRSPISGRWGQM